MPIAELMNKNIVIYGGSFNPPHKDHGKVIDVILHHFLCDEIWVLPSPDRRDKKMSVTGWHRLEMLKIMVKELFTHPPIPIVVSDFEIQRPDKPTTYETLAALKEIYPNYDFWFVIGSDIVGDIKTHWVKGSELFNEANFLIVHRCGYSLCESLLPSHKILDYPINNMNISSTMIRELVSAGKDFSHYLSYGVAEYIKKHELYKNSQ